MMERMKKGKQTKLLVRILKADLAFVQASAKKKGLTVPEYLLDLAAKDIIFASSLAESRNHPRQNRADAVAGDISKR